MSRVPRPIAKDVTHQLSRQKTHQAYSKFSANIQIYTQKNFSLWTYKRSVFFPIRPQLAHQRLFRGYLG